MGQEYQGKGLPRRAKRMIKRKNAAGGKIRVKKSGYLEAGPVALYRLRVTFPAA
jgi:hypothetical protein